MWRPLFSAISFLLVCDAKNVWKNNRWRQLLQWWWVEYYNGYKQCKGQNEQLEKELILIAWHPMRIEDWCIAENEKKKI